MGDEVTRKNLVVVRAGDQSLHPTWSSCAEEPEFDLIVSYFGSDLTAYRSERDPRHDFVGGKWDGIAHLFRTRADLLDVYEYVWLPDDDIACDTKTINEIFRSMRRHSLRLAQPSLSLDSHYSFLAYLHSRTFEVRYADCIEIMAPCVHIDLLRKIIPLVAASPSGWGLDAVWTRLCDHNHCKSGILDTCIVRHTRPVGGTLYGALARQGRTAQDDLAAMRAIFGKLRLYPIIYEAVDRSGMRWRSKAAIGLRLWLDFVNQISAIKYLRPHKNDITAILRRQMFKPMDLLPLSPMAYVKMEKEL